MQSLYKSYIIYKYTNSNLLYMWNKILVNTWTYKKATCTHILEYCLVIKREVNPMVCSELRGSEVYYVWWIKPMQHKILHMNPHMWKAGKLNLNAY